MSSEVRNQKQLTVQVADVRKSVMMGGGSIRAQRIGLFELHLPTVNNGEDGKVTGKEELHKG